MKAVISAYSQSTKSIDSIQTLTLDQCIGYALQNQPSLNRAIINKSIVRMNNAIDLSAWLPQVTASGNLIHYIKLPSFPNSVQGGPGQTRTVLVNTAVPQLSVSEVIFNPQVLHAAGTVSLFNRQAEQITDSAKINLVSSVSKSFFNLLLTLEQVTILKEDTARLGRNVADTYQQFIGGTADQTDYDEAVITLNNSKVQLKQQVENIAPAYANLKALIGYPPERQFNVLYDTAQMEKQVSFDTTQFLQYENRIEFQQFQTEKEIQHHLTNYYKYSFLPSISAIYNYYHEYESNSFSTLFNKAYPYSYVGLSVNIPLFTGFSRLENIHKSKLQELDLNWIETDLKLRINSEYRTSLANYKSNLYNWSVLKENELKARSVYEVVSLQYQQGVVPYLNLIVAESNLISAEIGRINALFQLLSSKTDLQKAIGAIPIP